MTTPFQKKSDLQFKSKIYIFNFTRGGGLFLTQGSMEIYKPSK